MSIDHLEKTLQQTEEQLTVVLSMKDSGCYLSDLEQDLEELISITKDQISSIKIVPNVTWEHSVFVTLNNGDSIRTNCIILSDSDLLCHVLLCTPLEEAQIPCSDFLEDTCMLEDCRFNHGISVPKADLLPVMTFRTEDFFAGSTCLFKEGELWRVGTVEKLALDGLSCQITAENLEKTVLVDNLSPTEIKQHITEFPEISGTSKDIPPNSVKETKSSRKFEDKCLKGRKGQIVKPKSGSNGKFGRARAPSPEFGDWEKHTKGIGLKLLRQMGYSGKGLGKLEDGSVEPVAVTVSKKQKCLKRPKKKWRISTNGNKQPPEPLHVVSGHMKSLRIQLANVDRRITVLGDKVGILRKMIERNEMVNVSCDSLNETLSVVVSDLADKNKHKHKLCRIIESKQIKHKMISF